MYPRLHRSADGAPARLRSLGRAAAAHAGLALGMLLAILVLGEWVYGQVFRAEGFAAGAEILPRLGTLLAVSVINYLWLAILIGLDRQWIAALGLVAILAVKAALALRWIPLHGVRGMVDAALWAEIPVSLLVGFAACRLYLGKGRT